MVFSVINFQFLVFSNECCYVWLTIQVSVCVGVEWRFVCVCVSLGQLFIDQSCDEKCVNSILSNKKYFIMVFSVINFQFLVLSNECCCVWVTIQVSVYIGAEWRFMCVCVSLGWLFIDQSCDEKCVNSIFNNKKYFVIVFSVINFQFLICNKISSI